MRSPESWREVLEVLRHESAADEGSFLIKLRTDLHWDTEAFSRLTAAMGACCVEMAGKDVLERWLANFFWYVPTFVREWTSHSNFPHSQSQEYYERAYRRLDDLAHWFFMGQSPYQDGRGFEPI